jgi:hypothetical protein
MSGRPGVRGGAPTRGFPPGSALVLGGLAAVVGLRRDEPLLAVVFLAVALAGAVGLYRLLRS